MRRLRPMRLLLLVLGAGISLAVAGCSSSPGAVCGNGVVEGAELCDNGTQPGSLGGGACTSTCTWQEYNPDTAGTGNAIRPSVAMNRAGQYVVVWQASGGTGAEGQDIYAAVFGASGSLLMPAFRVNEITTVDQEYPSVAIAGDGRFVVTWHTTDPYGGHDDLDNVSMRAFLANGLPATPELQVNTYTTGRQNFPSVGVNEPGDLVIAWSSDGQDGDLTGVYAALGSVDGQLLAAEPFQVNTEIINLQEKPNVGVADDGRFVITWESTGQEST
ncbi:MAG: hypothetical protein ABI333_07780 [bacterium]